MSVLTCNVVEQTYTNRWHGHMNYRQMPALCESENRLIVDWHVCSKVTKRDIFIVRRSVPTASRTHCCCLIVVVYH